MADRRTTSPPSTPERDGSSVPARLRIVAWIVLAASLGLLAVVLTIRSALLTDVDRSANEQVAQEVDEFRTFTARGLDPTTGAPFTSTDRLLLLHLERQFPSAGEVLVGYDTAAPPGRSPYVVQSARDRFGLFSDRELLDRLVTGEARSGTAETGGGAFRWGKADVVAADGTVGGVFFVAQFTGPAREDVERTVRLVVAVCLGGLLLTAAFAYVVAGQILAPVRAVERAASRISRADRSERIDVRGRDDVAALALTFNAMLDRLDAAFTAQRRFAAVASRQLRRPLAVLADEAASPAERRGAVVRTGDILDDLAVLAASETPDFLAPATVSAAELTELLAADVRAIDPARSWTVPESSDVVTVLDATRVRQAVRRLALNALQQTPGSSALRLGSRSDGAALEVWVADDGPGLSPEHAARVLDRYQDTDDDEHSAGLGLAVVRAVADAHDGSAWVETEPGHGSVFGLRLPLRTPRDAPSDDPADVEPAVVR